MDPFRNATIPFGWQTAGNRRKTGTVFGQHPSPRNASVDHLGCETFERVWAAATGSHKVTGNKGTIEVVVECGGASAPKLTRLSSLVV